MDRFICHGLNELQIGSKQSMRVQKKEKERTVYER